MSAPAHGKAHEPSRILTRFHTLMQLSDGFRGGGTGGPRRNEDKATRDANLAASQKEKCDASGAGVITAAGSKLTFT